MSSPAAQTIAEQLLAARRERRQTAPPPSGQRPRDAAAAYEIQDAVVAALGPIGGWKVGAGSAAAEPICAPLPASLVAAGPLTVPSGDFANFGIEAEIAFRIGADLPSRGRPYTEREVVAAIAVAKPAIEVVESRWTGWPRVDSLWQLADHQSNGMLVYGQGRPDWHEIDFTIQPVTLTIDGRVVAETIGGNAAGNPLRLVTWLANHAASRCGGLKAGQTVTTGSCTGMTFARAGSAVAASFPGLGDVEVTFAATD